MSYQIEVNLIPGLPKIPFRYGIGAYEGIVDHCTDSPNHSGGDTPTKERNYEATSFDSAFTHFFIGVENNQAKIIQNAEIGYIAFGAAQTANQRFLHLELCMYDDPTLFKIAYDAYVWLSAKLLRDKNLGVTDKGTIWSHKEISDEWHESTHQDPVQYLLSHGITWDQHVANVQTEYNALGSFRIKVLASELWYYDKPDWNAKKAIVKAGEVFTVVDTLTVLGNKMYKLKSGTFITANPKFVQVI